MKAIDKAVEDLWETEPKAVEADTPAGTPSVKFLPTRTKRADALELLAESFLQNGAATLSGGDKAIVEDEHGDPLSVGRKTRSIPSALQRALRSRDKGCRFPGCCNTRYTDAHHIRHWARGGETKLSNLVTLCRFHHRAVHEGKVVVQVLDDGAIRFSQPNGESFQSTAPNHSHRIGDWRELPRRHQEQEIAIDARTAVTRWDGGPMDFGMGVDGLLRRWRDGKNPPRGGLAAA